MNYPNGSPLQWKPHVHISFRYWNILPWKVPYFHIFDYFAFSKLRISELSENVIEGLLTKNIPPELLFPTVPTRSPYLFPLLRYDYLKFAVIWNFRQISATNFLIVENLIGIAAAKMMFRSHCIFCKKKFFFVKNIFFRFIGVPTNGRVRLWDISDFVNFCIFGHFWIFVTS